MKKVLITGASGFVGKKLALVFLSKGYNVTGLGTSLTHPFSNKFNNFKWVSANTAFEGQWQDHVPGADIIINLAGRNIFRFWTQKYKRSIYDSRILTTRNIVNALKNDTAKLITTSAVGIYGDRKEDVLTEESSPGKGFLADVCMDWETEVLKARDKGVSVSIMRFGVVLGQQGALPLMVPIFKLFAGGPLGSGKQWFSWIHIKDLERAVEFIADNKDLEGIFNFTGPSPVRQRYFAASLGQVLSRPAIIPAPSFIVKTVMGQLGEALLQSQRAVPENLMASGFSFLFPDVKAALCDILKK